MPFLRKSLIIPAFVLTILIYTLFNGVEPKDQLSIDLQKKPGDGAEKAEKPANANTDTRVHWQTRSEKYPVETYLALPTGRPEKIPKIQYDFPKERSSDRRRRLERQAAVKEAFVHAWDGYKQYAWLKDEVSPIKAGYLNSFAGWAATLVDTLDALLMLDMTDEFEKALEALDSIDFTTTEDLFINVFETTIRYLGGFMAAYDLSNGKYPVLLKKATEVADLLYGAFDTPNRMQVTRWEWQKTLQGKQLKPAPNTMLAEFGSLSLEFTRLTQLTGDPKYFDAIQRITDNLEEAQSKTAIPGLWPTFLDADKLVFDDKRFTLGGMADSTYEYLPKEHLLLGGRTNQYQRMYEATVEPIKNHLIYRPMTKEGEDILFTGNAQARDGTSHSSLEPEAQHLTCYVGGMVGIAAKVFKRPEDLSTARKLVDGCIWAYDSMPTGMMPELFHTTVCEEMHDCPWDESRWLADVRAAAKHRSQYPKTDNMEEAARMIIKEDGLQPGFTRINDAQYHLRPEAIESVFIMYRITGDKTLQDAAWRMFTSIEKMTRTDIAHAGISDVRIIDTQKTNRMESFWLAETLKYFYLIFSEPDLVSLDDYVFNTEAHPFKRPKY